MFQVYRDVKVRVLACLRDQSAKRAENLNKTRRHKTIHEGDEVVFQDPRNKKAGGRKGYKVPFADPALVVSTNGNKCKLKTRDGRILEDVHLENVLLVPK